MRGEIQRESRERETEIQSTTMQTSFRSVKPKAQAVHDISESEPVDPTDGRQCSGNDFDRNLKADDVTVFIVTHLPLHHQSE